MLSAFSMTGADWPLWRGERRDGTTTETVTRVVKVALSDTVLDSKAITIRSVKYRCPVAIKMRWLQAVEIERAKAIGVGVFERFSIFIAMGIIEKQHACLRQGRKALFQAIYAITAINDNQIELLTRGINRSTVMSVRILRLVNQPNVVGDPFFDDLKPLFVIFN